MTERRNPFPGPQPYTESDKAYFFGRETLIKRLENQIVAYPLVLLHGPSGAGKSSVMQAGVIPRLVEGFGYRVVRISGWPAQEAPASWLLHAVREALSLEEPQGDAGDTRGLLQAAVMTALEKSDAPVLIYLDQFEQLYFTGRDAKAVTELCKALNALAQQGLRGVHVALTLREDYLGRFRDRNRDLKALMAHAFRVGPLSVQEMTTAVCRAARAGGGPEERWSEPAIGRLMLDVRVPGQLESNDAEVEAAFGQIVCRALWEQHEAGKESSVKANAEEILRRYLDHTVERLGVAPTITRAFLEQHLIDPRGNRRLLTEQEATAALPNPDVAKTVLDGLEKAAVLRAEEHKGSRYFELGHDWLLAKVFERRKAREEWAKRRRLGVIAGVSLLLAFAMGILVLWALRQRDQAEKAKDEALRQRTAARDSTLMIGVRELLEHEQTGPVNLLLEIKRPEEVRGWVQLALEALSLGVPGPVLRGHEGSVRFASFSPDGRRIVTASDDGTARVWNADGSGSPLVLKGHDGVVNSAAFSPDGRRIVTVSEFGTARVWNADGSGSPLVLDGHDGSVKLAAFSPDGGRIVTASYDNAQVWNADGSGSPLVLKGRDGRVRLAAFSPDGRRIVTASYDNAQVWNADGLGSPLVLKGHEGVVYSAAFSPDGRRIVTASHDKTARVWNADSSGSPLVLKGVRLAAFSPDGGRIVSALEDKSARVWNADGSGSPLVLKGHDGVVKSAAFSPDGRRIVTASKDTTVRIWPLDIPTLTAALRSVNTGCLTVEQRRLYLDESDDAARAAYEACERSHGRTP